MKLNWTFDGSTTPGGFVADVDGYLCFLLPSIESGRIVWKWLVQSGGGWTHRGGAEVVKHAEGTAFSTYEADAELKEALAELGADLVE